MTRHGIDRRAGIALAAAVLAFAAFAVRAEPAVDAAMAVAYDEALAEYERCHWPEAFQALAQLADRGHAQAARVALQMRRFGPALYGWTFTASAAQIGRWTLLRGCAGETTHPDCRLALQAP